jgi:hypothetical protein
MSHIDAVISHIDTAIFHTILSSPISIMPS